MKKLVIICGLLVSLVATAKAGCDAIVLAHANIDNLPLQNKHVALHPVVTEKYEYYDVHGACENDLQCELRQKSVPWDDGKKYESVTSWRVKWDYGYDRAPKACSPDSFHVTVDIVFRYPRWVSAADAPSSLADKWQSYMKNLMTHEQGHRDMAVDAAAELVREVSAMPVSSTCEELDRKIRTLCRVRMNRLNDEEKQYDTETRHGYTQGAIFP